MDLNAIHQGAVGFRVRVSEAGMTFARLDWPTEAVHSEVRLPYPSAGVGGTVLTISPRGNYAAATIYSGQSEEGYQLFALTPKLHHLGGMPYTIGESDSTPVQFSPDESLAAIAIEEGDGMWWVDPTQEDRDWETPAAGSRVQWATLFIHRIGEANPSEYALTVDVPAGWYPLKAGTDLRFTWPIGLKFESQHTMSLGIPWDSRFRFELPRAGEAIVVPPPKG